jgi:hypothetical protein
MIKVAEQVISSRKIGCLTSSMNALLAMVMNCRILNSLISQAWHDIKCSIESNLFIHVGLILEELA